MLLIIAKKLGLPFLCIFSTGLQAQIIKDSVCHDHRNDTIKKRDLIDVTESLFNVNIPDGPDSSNRKFGFSVLPLSTDVPGGGTAFATTVSTTFYLGNRRRTSQSEVWFFPYFDFDGRYGIPIRSYVWLKDNRWLLRGDIRILKYPEYTWGIGNAHLQEDNLRVNRSYFRLYQHLLRQVSPGLFMGLGYNLDIHSGIGTDSAQKTLSEFANYKHGTENRSTSSGINFNILYDTRGNSINPTSGDYLNLEYRVNPEFMGSDHWWHSLYIDVRKYYRLGRNKEQQNLIALWSYYWTTFQSNPPYFDLPSIGWDTYNTSGRGIIQSRYRSKSLFYAEAEYRRDITRDGLLGFVLFANINSVNDPTRKIFSDWNLGAGGGLRIKVDKHSGTNISLDYGVSRDYQGIYLTLGEYF